MTRVKICGITNREDADAAVEAGADALGFIFYEQSPRYVSPKRAAEIISTLPPFIIPVGVFVNQERETICDSIHESGIPVVQLHGEEGADFCRSIPAKVIKAFRVRDKNSLSDLTQYRVSAILLDSYTKKAYGGSGISFDWGLAAKAKKDGRVILAGGLTPANVYKAVVEVRPYAVDVSSGVEEQAGKKDVKQMRRFIQEVRRADESSG